MRIMVFFDLPVLTDKNKHDYRIFRKHLIKLGFIMNQQSVYCKLVQNGTVADSVAQSIRDNKPPIGLVQVLKITEKQYSKMEYVVGEHTSPVIDSDERIIIL